MPEPYTKIPHSLLESITKLRSLSEIKVILFACRKINGYHKKHDKLSISQIIKGTDLCRSGAIIGVKNAMRDGYLDRQPSGLSYQYTISKSFNQKLVHETDQSTKQTSLQNRPELVHETDRQVVHGIDTQKIYIKDNIKIDTENGDKTELPTTSVKRLFTDLWCLEWERAFGSRYDFKGVIDGRAADSLLKLGMPPERLMEIAKKAWCHQMEPKMFWCKKAVTLNGFSSKITEIRQEVGELQTTIKSKPISTDEYLNEV